MRRRLKIAGLVALLGLPVMAAASLWFATNQLLFPSWAGATKDLSVCNPELAAHWGPDCGNVRAAGGVRFEEVQIRSVNGYDLPGWRVGALENGHGPAKGAVLLVHGGGSDRREVTRHIPFFLGRGLDVLAVDLGCHGEAPCPVPGLSYGHRESRDVLSAYLHLLGQHERVYAMGSSVGAASILIALPQMPKLSGVIAENPLASFQRLIREAPEARSMPRPFVEALIRLTMLRGRFDGLSSAESSLRLAKGTPIYFLHSTRDSVASYRQTEELAQAYRGPKTTWFPDVGGHGAIWNAGREEYERRLAAFLDSAQAAMVESASPTGRAAPL